MAAMASDTSEIRTILEAAYATALDLLGPLGWNVGIAVRPAYDVSVQALIPLPACVVATRGDLVEGVKALNFRNDCTQLRYEVFVGLFVDKQAQTLSQFWKRAAARQLVRRTGWNPKLIDDPDLGDYDVDYQPFAMLAEAPPPNVDGSWQQFTVTIKARRQT